MLKLIATAALASLALLPVLAGAATLTDMETRWLKAAAPVLAYSQRLKLPVDIVVQPKAGPNDVPLAMGFVNGRCKLVLSMRGNPDAEKILDSVAEAERPLLIEAMAAHELGHCWRNVQGVWHVLPAGFVETGEEQADNPALLAESKALRDMRREEGYADLVALAWIKRTQPEQYARVYAWMANLRATAAVPRGGHDTGVWLKLARDPAIFQSTATAFDDAGAAWSQGLLSDE